MYLPDGVEYIINKLYESGYEGFAVGGCVRDSLIGREPGDYDITTSASPDEIIHIFSREKTVPTGKKYGTVTVIVGNKPYEVTTYRIDVGYTDNRRPDEVKFTSSIEEELGRRDFTINSMAYNQRNGLIDLFKGQEDIKSRIIKCVGEPDRRFKEDALRMMRAVRFAAQLNFNIESNTLLYISQNAALLKRISAERKAWELNKMLLSQNTDKMELLFSTGLMEYIIPELAYMKQGSLKYFSRLKPKLDLRLTALFISGDVLDRKLIESVLRGLRYDNSTIRSVSCFAANYCVNIECDRAALRRLLRSLGKENLLGIIELRKALEESDSDKLEAAEKLIDDITGAGECCSMKTLAVNGEDMKDLGFSGMEIGKILDYLLSMVINDPEMNKRDLLMEIADKTRISNTVED